MSVTTKVVIVTGASSGIGAAIAVKFCEVGARVSLVGRNQGKLKTVLEKCQKTIGKAHVITADVTKEDDAKRIVEETLQQFGKIDILINNAGIFGTTSILEDKVMEKYEKIMNVNFRAVVRMTNLCAKYIVETKGNIINISSVASTMTSTFLIYAASKAALDHFSRCVALELAPKGVRVNTVNPGPVKTDFVETMNLSNEEQDVMWNLLRKSTALNRIADPEEIAELVAFVASDQGRSITGSSILSDNGCMLQGYLSKSSGYQAYV